MTRILLLTVFACVGSASASAHCPTDSTTTAKKRPVESKGNWSGISFNALSMAQFQGNLENYDATWGAREDLGLITDDAFESFRLSINPFEKRQKLLGEFFGITTGIGFDWLRLGVDPERRLVFNEATSTVLAESVDLNTTTMRVNRVNAVYLRVPVLASVHLFRSGGKGLHAEERPGSRIPVARQIQPRIRARNNRLRYRRGFPCRTHSTQCSIGRRLWQRQLVSEAALLPFFDESPADSPSMHSFSLGLQIALND